jgi:acetyl/propionyl-CoA carboxylase alpha subunit
LFERECSIQRRFQKIVEESPSTALSADQRARMTSAAVALAQTQRYAGAGTVEFVFDDDRGEFHFLEMNTRIQVEHPVTELLTGLDLVALQLRLAGGEALALTQADVRAQGHAIEVRLCAENPAKNFLPATGRLEALVFPTSPGLRVDTGVRSGDAISHHYDSMIAKLIVHGADRPQAIARLAQALGATVVQGPANNLVLLQRVAAHPAFVAGRTHTSFLTEHRAALLAAEANQG